LQLLIPQKHQSEDISQKNQTKEKQPKNILWYKNLIYKT